MDYQGLLKNKIEENKDEMIAMLQELIGIRSVVEPAKGDMPFGAGVQKAFEYMLERGRKEGFDVENVENYGGHIDFGGYLQDSKGNITAVNTETMGIVCHLDTVPEGDGWSHPPFSGEIADGKIFGRGAIDNKGPAVSSFFAMKALKDLGIMPEKRVRLILGLDEETGWIGMRKYLEKVKAPDFGFTPDAEFPAIHAEKGVLIFDIAKKFAKSENKGLELRSFTGGEAPNMVAANARVILRSDKKETYEEIKAKVAEFRETARVQIRTKVIGKTLEIVTTGVSAHGARPETGVNAISAMMDFLGSLSFSNEDVNDFIDFYNRHIGYELNGNALGCGLSDEPSGDLVLNVGMIELDPKAGRLTINVRYPVTLSEEDVYGAIMPVVNKYHFGVIKGLHHKPLYRPLDDPFIKTLMDCYQENTGDVETQPLVIGGGTYARAMDHCVAFGASFPGEHEVAHQKDEYLSIDSLMAMTNIYADAIYRLTVSQEDSAGSNQ
jgi:succinyl-diaminopimelate desuccinylase